MFILLVFIVLIGFFINPLLGILLGLTGLTLGIVGSVANALDTDVYATREEIEQESDW